MHGLTTHKEMCHGQILLNVDNTVWPSHSRPAAHSAHPSSISDRKREVESSEHMAQRAGRGMLAS